MDFHGMKRKDLQALCKKHGIPANLKNIEMASRLASVFEKETEETFTDTISLSEDSVDVLKDGLVVKKVRFSPENEVFEFTRSVKRCQRKNFRKRSKGINVQDLQESGIELRRSKRSVGKGIAIAESNENELKKRRGRCSDVSKALKVPRRSNRICSGGSTQENCKVTGLMALEKLDFEDTLEGLSGNDQDGFKLEKIGRRATRLTSKAGTLPHSKRSKLLVDIEDKEDELVKNNVKEIYMDFKFQETEIKHKKDVHGDPKVEKVHRRSRRLVNEIDVQTNTQDRRRSKRLKARAVNSSMGDESSDGRPLCSAKESKEETKTTKESKRYTVVNIQEGELVKIETKKPLIDCEVQTTEDYRRMKVHDGSKDEKVLRRSKRRCNNINVLMDKRPIKTVKCDDLGVKKALKQSRQREKSLCVPDGQAQKGDIQPKRTFGNGREDNKLLRSSTHTTLDNMLGQAMSTSPKRCSVIDCERDGASVDNVKSSVNDEMQVHARFSRNSSRYDSFEAPIVEGDLVEKKTEESLEKKWDRSAQSNQTPGKLLDQYAQFEQEEAAGANVGTRGSSKRSKAMNHKSFKENPQGMIENSPSSSNTKAAESVMITENVLDSTPEKAVDSSQRTNIQELNSELMEDKSEVKDESLKKSEQRSSFERGCKLNELELRRCSSTDFTSHSLKEKNVSKCFEEDKTKALSLPLPRNNYSSAFDELATPERKLMLMEQISEKGKTLAADSVTQNNDETVESHVVVFTTPKKVSPRGDAGIDEAGNEEGHTATEFPDGFDVSNTTERYLMLGGSKQSEARNEDESIVVELHDIATISERKFTVGDFKGDRFGMNEENRTVELQRETGTCTSLDTHTLLGDYVSGGGNKPMEFNEESVVYTDTERHELFGSFEQDKARESEGKKVVQFYEESGLSTGVHKYQPVGDSELSETGGQGINSSDKSGLFTSVERQLLYGGSEQKEAVKTGEKAGVEFHDVYAVPVIAVRHPFPEDSELEEAAKGEENKPVELRVDSGIFTSAEKHLLLETDEGVKGDNITAKSHVVSDVLTAAEGQFLMGQSEPDEAEKKCRENKDVELLGESNTSTNPERHMLFGVSELDGTKNIRDYTATTCIESFVTTSPERRQLLVNIEPYSGGKQEQKEVEDNVVQGSLIAAPDFRENTIAGSSGSITSKVSYSHEFNDGKETAGAELMPIGSQEEDVVGLHITQGTSKKSSEHFPLVDSLNPFDFDTEEAEAIIEAERNVSFSSYVTLPDKDNSKTIDETSSYLDVAGTCTMVSEEPGPSTDIQNQVQDRLEGLAITTDNNDADELIEAKVTKNIQLGYEENILLNSSGGSYVSGKTCILARTEDEDEAAEKAISLTPDEFIVQNNMNEKDTEMISREAIPSPEETLNASSETRKEYLCIDESGALSERQVRREPILIYRTQVKPQGHDMKENAPNSKIEQYLNVTALRTSKRQPLQDLRKI